MNAIVEAGEGPLTWDEAQRLRELTRTIRGGFREFLEVGRALVEVQRKKLWRGRSISFEAYCREQFAISSSHAYSLMSSARAADEVTALGLPAPATHAQAREIAKIPQGQRAPVWRMAVNEAGGQPEGSRVAQLAAAAREGPSLSELIVKDEEQAARLKLHEEATRRAATEIAKRDRALASLRKAARHALEAGWAETSRAVLALLEAAPAAKAA